VKEYEGMQLCMYILFFSFAVKTGSFVYDVNIGLDNWQPSQVRICLYIYIYIHACVCARACVHACTHLQGSAGCVFVCVIQQGNVDRVDKGRKFLS
jgi:hypothetical protein